MDAGRPVTPTSRMRVEGKGSRFPLRLGCPRESGRAPGGPVTCFPAEHQELAGYCGEGARVRRAHCHQGQCVPASSALRTQVLGTRGSATEIPSLPFFFTRRPPELENPEGALQKSRSRQTQAPGKGCVWLTCFLWVGIHLLLKQLLSASPE